MATRKLKGPIARKATKAVRRQKPIVVSAPPTAKGVITERIVTMVAPPDRMKYRNQGWRSRGPLEVSDGTTDPDLPGKFRESQEALLKGEAILQTLRSENSALRKQIMALETDRHLLRMQKDQLEIENLGLRDDFDMALSRLGVPKGTIDSRRTGATS